MRNVFLTLFLAVLSLSLSAQSYVHRILVLNEGYFDFITNEVIIPPSVGAYDPSTMSYTQLFTIEDARFTSGIAFDDDRYYVAADGQVLVVDRLTDEVINTYSLPGVRKLAVWNDLVVATRGEYGVPFGSYVQVFNKSDFSLAGEIPATDLPYTTEGVLVVEDKAYIAVNNGFVFGEEVGQLAVLDLATLSLEEVIDLGPDGINPDNLMRDGDKILTLNNKDYTGSSVSSYRITTGDLSTANLANVTSGCGTSALYNSEVYYQDFLSTALTRYAPESEEIITELELGQNLYGLVFDPYNERFYAGVTDFFSSGTLYVYDLAGNVLDTETVNVSPGNIALDVRTTTSIEEQAGLELELFPNPATTHLTVKGSGMLRVYNSAGALVMDMQAADALNLVDIEGLANGVYTLELTAENGQRGHRTFVKQ
jgi:hypothetical protein